MTTQVLTTTSSAHLLSMTLKANAAFSTLSGLLFLIAAGQVAAFLGLPAPGSTVIFLLGIGLLGFAGLVYRVATQSPVNPVYVKSIIAADISWVIASWGILLVGLPPLSTGGFWATAIVADMVLVFAIMQFYGLRKIQ